MGGGGGLQITAKLQFRTSSNYHPIIKHIQLSQWLIKAFIRQKVKLFQYDETLSKTNASKYLLKKLSRTGAKHFFILLKLSDFLLLTDAFLSPQT